jgi:hypothetical protein
MFKKRQPSVASQYYKKIIVKNKKYPNYGHAVVLLVQMHGNIRLLLQAFGGGIAC